MKKWKEINLHLILSRSESLPLKLTLSFNPCQWGNKSLFRIVDDRFLKFEHWEGDIEEEIDEGIDIGPIVATVILIRKAYYDLPFLKEAARTFVHAKRARFSREQFFELARTIEQLGENELNFKNVIPRVT